MIGGHTKASAPVPAHAHDEGELLCTVQESSRCASEVLTFKEEDKTNTPRCRKQNCAVAVAAFTCSDYGVFQISNMLGRALVSGPA